MLRQPDTLQHTISGISHKVIDILEIYQHLWLLLATFSLRMRISVYLGGSSKKNAEIGV